MLRVDDIICAGSATQCKLAEACLNTFRHSAYLYMGRQSPLVFRDVDIALLPSRGGLSFSSYGMIRRTKSFHGACNWLFRTRFDIISDACRLASDIPTDVLNLEHADGYIKDTRKLAILTLEGHLPLLYRPLPRNMKRQPELLVCRDASFASLRAGGSVEACRVIYGYPPQTKWRRECRGGVVSFYARRVLRVADLPPKKKASRWRIPLIYSSWPMRFKRRLLRGGAIPNPRYDLIGTR